VAVTRGDARAWKKSDPEIESLPNTSFLISRTHRWSRSNRDGSIDGDRAEAWVPSQFQTLDQMAIGQVLGVKPEQVTFHTEFAAAVLAGALSSMRTCPAKRR
jgi:hypothetical protein